MAEQIKLDIEISQIRNEIIALRMELGKIPEATKAAFAPEGSGAVKQAAEVEKLISEYKTLKNAADTLRTALKTAYDPRAIEVYARELKNAETGLKKLDDVGKAVGVNLKKAGKEGSLAANLISEAFGAITKATVILAIIDQVYKLTKAAISLSIQFDQARRAFTAFTGDAAKGAQLVASLQQVANANFIDVDKVFEAGKSLLAFGESAEKLPAVLTRISVISQASGKDFNELAVIYGKARTSGVLFAEDINQLVDAGIPVIQEFAKQLGVSTTQVKKLASEGKISFEELQLAFFNLSKEGTSFNKLAKEQAESLPGLWQQTTQKLKPLLQDVGDFFSKILKNSLIAIDYYLDQIGLKEEKLQSLSELQNDALFKSLEAQQQDSILFVKQKSAEQLQLEKEAADKRAELAGTNNKKAAEAAAKAALELAKLRIEAMREGEAKELAQEDLRNKELIAQLKKHHIDTVDAEAQHEANRLDIHIKYVNERIKQQADLLTKIDDLDKKQFDLETKNAEDIAKAKLEAITQKKDLKNLDADIAEADGANLIAVLKRNGAKEADIKEAERILDLNVKKARLQAELEFQGALLGTIENGDDGRLAVVIKNIDKIKAEIAGLDASIGDKPKGGLQKKSFAELIGIPPEFQDDFNKAADQIKSGLNDLTEARVRAAEAAVQAADMEIKAAQDNVSAAQEALDSQIQIADLGFASDVSLANQRLQQAQEEEAQAKQRRVKALEDQKKAQKQQLLVDSLTQSSNIAVSITNLVRSWSSIPFGIGLVLAFAQAATLISFLASTKAKARAISTQAREGITGHVGERGIIVGPSHDAGGVPLEVEGGEFVYQNGRRISVVKRSATQTHFDLLQAINNDDRPSMARYLSRLTGGISRNADATAEAARQASGGSRNNNVGIAIADPETHRLLEENNRLQKKIIKLEEDKIEYVDEGDHILKMKGGREMGRIKKTKSR